MFNFDKLNGRIVEKFKTRAAFAKAMDLGAGRLSERLSGTVPFRTTEILKAMELLDIAPEEVGAYFFTKKVR